jgi:hypothetical protein
VTSSKGGGGECEREESSEQGLTKRGRKVGGGGDLGERI